MSARKIFNGAKLAAVVIAIGGLWLASGCATHRTSRDVAKWEYKTIVTPNDAVPLNPPGDGWISNDKALNQMLKDGWTVAGYGVDHMNSQWFLLKRHKR